jgi:hypothetical protein
MILNKERYRCLCKSEKSIPIFSQDWWLDSACGDNWDVCLFEDSTGIIAVLPFFKSYNRFGMLSIVGSPHSQYLGPWMRSNSLSATKKLALEKKVFSYLIDSLPEYSLFCQNMHYNYTNWLPFYWKDFSQTTRYTYIIKDLSNLSLVYSNFTSSYRNKIKNANEKLLVSDNLSLEEFYRLNKMTFDRQGIEIPYTFEFLKRRDDVLIRENRRKIFFARDSQDRIHSAIYLIWDNQSSYLHMVGEDPTLRNSGAGIFLVWHAIQYTSEILKLDVFDFEGSMIEKVEHVRRDFGAVQVPYFELSKVTSKILKLKSILNEFRV